MLTVPPPQWASKSRMMMCRSSHMFAATARPLIVQNPSPLLLFAWCSPDDRLPATVLCRYAQCVAAMTPAVEFSAIS